MTYVVLGAGLGIALLGFIGEHAWLRFMVRGKLTLSGLRSKRRNMSTSSAGSLYPLAYHVESFEMNYASAWE